MATALKDARIQLNDPRLFREQCYIDGAWIDAGSRKTIAVTDPATGETIGTVPTWAWRRRGAPSRRRSAALPAGAPRPARSARRSCASGSS